MSSLARRMSPYLIGVLTSPLTRDVRRWLVEQRRRLSGQRQRVLYFHQIDDPYSQLAAQVLPELLARYEVELVPYLVGPPSDAAAPERQRLADFARRDAADVAPGYGLDFPAGASAPAPECVELSARMLAPAIADGGFATLAARAGAALWRGDRARLEALARESGVTDLATANAALATGSRLREQLGHYLGGMLYYAGEWYWGVDRLHFLERRLRSLRLLRKAGCPELVAPRPDPSVEPVPASQGRLQPALRPDSRAESVPVSQGRLQPALRPDSSAESVPASQGRLQPALRPDPTDEPVPASQGRLQLEYYPSLRSPYTAIVMDRVLALPKRLPVDLVLRPVLPMVMRGLPVPREKQLYITLDTKREAEDAGVVFGRVCDPVGRPVERCFSLYPWAKQQGRAFELLRSFTQAAFAEGVDTGTEAGLRLVVERAGLRWDEALTHLDREGWRDELELNREQLLALGLWGVPSFRLLGRPGEVDYSTWGQDRLWRVEQEIRRRLSAWA